MNKFLNSDRQRLFRIWKRIRTRCYNKSIKEYPYYGGRGITTEWIHFSDFFRDMGNSYKAGLTIDRINNDGNYTKENCRWATRKEQANNRSSNIILEFQGQKKTLMQWSEERKLSFWALHKRFKRGWSTEKLLETPIQ